MWSRSRAQAKAEEQRAGMNNSKLDQVYLCISWSFPQFTLENCASPDLDLNKVGLNAYYIE